ncbi:type II toxin-antitoxin system PemK/MazF family toxin [Sphingomonas nostoxanthinifaciens]|uniref:type II toxin-antitoxin system PemK/MazF family toxin n=1 Tax=Sphingomonas nostoxanthinifaciens TaxID=2872652 RepID=UPI0021D81BB4|nr:type II toxin-antitoxin system PemK/MazF family toxin [Sphingomonas nostoxanthinifaciens]
MVPRPALVVSKRPLGLEGLLIWTMMITNADRAAWPGDVPIDDWQGLGLLIPSKVRTAKIAAVEAGAATLLGRLDALTWRTVRDHVHAALFDGP